MPPLEELLEDELLDDELLEDELLDDELEEELLELELEEELVVFCPPPHAVSAKAEARMIALHS